MYLFYNAINLELHIIHILSKEILLNTEWENNLSVYLIFLFSLTENE